MPRQVIQNHRAGQSQKHQCMRRIRPLRRISEKVCLGSSHHTSYLRLKHHIYDLASDIGGMHSIGAPIHIYPLYEAAFRAQRQQSLRENNEESAALYAAFAKVAAENPYSWNFGKPALKKEDIGSVSRKNRMICTPYPLLMNAFNTVNLAAAVILTSVENARKLGVPEEKWVYPLGGAGQKEKERCECLRVNSPPYTYPRTD